MLKVQAHGQALKTKQLIALRQNGTLKDCRSLELKFHQSNIIHLCRKMQQFKLLGRKTKT